MTITTTNVPLRLRLIFDILERAVDNNDMAVIAAARRLIVADRVGWRRARAGVRR
jgi:hypothetical protein